jgi:spermidine/putrescine transport system permease protein
MINRALLWLYMACFFGFLFGPVAVMAITAFNASSYPQAVPFEAFTLRWFAALAHDDDLMYGLGNSVRIGLCVVLLAVPIGLAAAIVMQQVYARARPFYYLVAVAPVLTPGIIIGIATVIFWRGVTQATGLRFLYRGDLLTVLGQSSFISSYCMLVFMARLQRFDGALAEAGLDLGATRLQVFWQILLPFLRPAIFSAAVIAFLSSFENYNTTTFAILADKTLVTVLAGRVRQGMTPSISAMAVAIVAATLAGALVWEVARRRQDARRARRLREADAAEARELAAA